MTPLPDEVERFDPISGVWSETVAMNTPRVGGAAAVTGGAGFWTVVRALRAGMLLK